MFTEDLDRKKDILLLYNHASITDTGGMSELTFPRELIKCITMSVILQQ